MNTLEIRSGRTRAVLTVTPGGLSVTVHRTPHPGSARFNHQLATRPRALMTGRPQEERIDHRNFETRNHRSDAAVRTMLSRNGLNSLTRADQRSVDALLARVYSKEATGAE